MYHILHKQRLVNTGLLLTLVGAAAALLAWPEAVATGVNRGLSICGTVIIPSLFPFLVLAGFLVRAGIAASLGRHSEKLTRLLFGLPGCCGTAILISIVGGYPAGGVAVGELVGSGAITPAQGRHLLRFCVNGGPAFIISAVGAGMLGSVRQGVLLFFSHIAVSLLIGVVSRPRKAKADITLSAASAVRDRRNDHKKPATKQPASAAFVESVNAACRSLLYMCGFVVLFSALLTLADVSGFNGVITGVIPAPPNWLPMLAEVSSGCIEASAAGRLTPLLLGMALGWGGLSVHCQLAATLSAPANARKENRLIDRRFFQFRLLHALLGGLAAWLVFRFAPIANPVFASSTPAVAPFTSSAAGSVALLLMCGMFMGTLGNSREMV